MQHLVPVKGMQERVSPPPPRATEPPLSQSPWAVHPLPQVTSPLPPQLSRLPRLPPRSSPRARSYSPDPMTTGQSRFLPPPGGVGVNAVAGGGHQGASADVHDKDHFPIAALDAAAEPSSHIGATTTTAKQSGVKQQKVQPAKRFKSPAGLVSPVSPLVPTRSTGIKMMISPANITSPATIDFSSSNGEM